MRAFPRQFWLLTGGFVVLLSGIDMCFPFETTYLRTELGVSTTAIGLLLGLPIFAMLPVHIFGGALADRIGRKPVMVIGGCVIVSLYLTFALATSLWQIAVAVAAEAGFGWAFFLTGSNAMVADLIPYERRAEAYSMTRVALGVGMVIGPLLAGLIIGGDGSYNLLFTLGASICAAYLIVVLTMFRETRPAAVRDEGMRATMGGYRQVLRDRRFLAFCAISLLPLYGFGQIWSIFPLALHAQHGISAHDWSLLLVFYAATSALFQYPVVRVLRRRDPFLLMAASSILTDGGLTAAVLLPVGPLTLVSIFAVAQGIILLIPISATISAELASPDMRGRYMGTWTLVQMGGYAIGPTLGGLAADRLGYPGAYALCGAGGVLGMMLFAGLARRLGAGRRSETAQRAAARHASDMRPGADTRPPNQEQAAARTQADGRHG